MTLYCAVLSVRFVRTLQMLRVWVVQFAGCYTHVGAVHNVMSVCWLVCEWLGGGVVGASLLQV